MTVISASTQLSKTFTPIILILAGIASQLLSYQPLWSHTSSSGEFLGRYSNRYAVILIAYVVIGILWLALLIWHRKVAVWLQRIPLSIRIGANAITATGLLALWVRGLEGVAVEYLLIQWFIANTLLLLALPDRPIVSLRWIWALLIVLILCLLLLFIHALTDRQFNPDEALWGDQASSYYVVGGLYGRTWLREPFVIEPGKGWSVVAYGWLLENVAFDVKVGRIWNFTAYLIGFLGIGAITWRLYGREAAAVSVAFAVLSRMFISIVDYRPDHQLAALIPWMVYMAIQARSVGQTRWRDALHFGCGLLSTLAMEFHGSAVTVAVGLSLFYSLEFLWRLYKERRWQVIYPVLAFAAGAAIGAAIYWMFNIQIVGGLRVYLDFLLEARWHDTRLLRFLNWPFLLESAFVWAGLAYITWRRSREDRLLLSIIVCILIGITLLDTQGYFSTYNTLFVVPVGVMLVYGLQSPSVLPGQNLRAALAAGAMTVLLIGQIFTYTSWPTFTNWIKTGQLPPFVYQEVGKAVEPYLNADDVLVSSQLLIWAFPHTPRLVAVGAEVTAMKRWGLDDPVEMWERVQPTVVVDMKNHMDISPGLRNYMSQNAFDLCEQFTVLDTQVDVYRMDCPT